MSRSTKKLLGPGPKFKDWGALADKLMLAFPKCKTKDGHLNVEKLTAVLETSKEGIYRWLREGKLPPKRALSLAKKSKGRVTFDELLPFVSF